MSELLQAIRPLVEGWERGDFRAGAEAVTPDALVCGYTADGFQRARGPAEIADYLRSFFMQFRDYHIDVARISELDASHVLLEGNQYGIGRSSGMQIAERLFIVFEVQGGRVSEMHWHPRREGALESAGLS